MPIEALEDIVLPDPKTMSLNQDTANTFAALRKQILANRRIVLTAIGNQQQTLEYTNKLIEGVSNLLKDPPTSTPDPNPIDPGPLVP